MLSLERHSVAQADSAVDLRYREVMDNLAQNYADPSTLPRLVTIYSGIVSVQDTGTLAGMERVKIAEGVICV